MDEQRKKEITKKVREEFQFGRARLFRPETERRVLAEMGEDRKRLFVHFTQPVTEENVELLACFKRYLLNFAKVASYRGILAGHDLFHLGVELGEDRARFYAIEYLRRHPEAKNEELVEYLDRKNSRLSALKTSKDDPLWAWLPRSLEQKFADAKIPIHAGSLWETALVKFPDPVMQYLSRLRRMAKSPEITNALFIWPRIIREHRKRRKKPKGVKEPTLTGPQ
ncbi:MAG: hypothetical protein P4N24_15680 [Acidobacteriota bacterium]|nr:hypothetical protein [Acidobacteriota bacterium]